VNKNVSGLSKINIKGMGDAGYGGEVYEVSEV
jgi:hypothetical protein